MQNTEHTNIAFTHEQSGTAWAQTIKSSIGNNTIEHINAHGPGDKLVDRIEVQALKRAFEKRLKDINITSIKSTTGGGNAFVSTCQVAATSKAIFEKKIPPTANYKTPDPELEGIIPVAKKFKPTTIKRALVNAYGMGGLSATLLLNKSK